MRLGMTLRLTDQSQRGANTPSSVFQAEIVLHFKLLSLDGHRPETDIFVLVFSSILCVSSTAVLSMRQTKSFE